MLVFSSQHLLVQSQRIHSPKIMAVHLFLMALEPPPAIKVAHILWVCAWLEIKTFQGWIYLPSPHIYTPGRCSLSSRTAGPGQLKDGLSQVPCTGVSAIESHHCSSFRLPPLPAAVPAFHHLPTIFPGQILDISAGVRIAALTFLCQ